MEASSPSASVCYRCNIDSQKNCVVPDVVTTCGPLRRAVVKSHTELVKPGVLRSAEVIAIFFPARLIRIEARALFGQRLILNTSSTFAERALKRCSAVFLHVVLPKPWRLFPVSLCGAVVSGNLNHSDFARPFSSLNEIDYQSLIKL